MSAFHTELLALGVVRVPIGFVNAYAVTNPDGTWALVDTGLPGAAGYLERFAEAEMGGPPAAIVLTHGHFDHAGNARALAEAFACPIYAHAYELPFLNGSVDYPPADSSMGGAIAHFARLFPVSGLDLGERLQALPSDKSVPGMPGWRFLHTPGHSNGHTSFFRDADAVLLAGDAIATMDLDGYAAQVTHARQLSRSAAPFTTNWDAVLASQLLLADLEPRCIGAGHGRVMVGPDLAGQLRAWATIDHRPGYGRYVATPVRFEDETGEAAVPPPVEDRAGKRLLVSAVAAGAGLWALDRAASRLLYQEPGGVRARRDEVDASR